MWRNFTLALLLSVGIPAAAAADSTLALRGALEQQLRIYQQAKDCKGVATLFYTEGVDKARRQALAKAAEDYLCANFDRTIASIAFQSIDAARQEKPASFNGKPSGYTLSPQGVIVIDYGKGKAQQPKSIALLYGIEDGKAWLVTTKNADTD